MAIVFFEDFEIGDGIGWITTGVTSYTTTPTMFGRSFRISGSTVDFLNSLKYTLTSTYNEGLVSFAIAVASLPAASRIFSIMNVNTHQISIYLNPDGSLAVSRNTTVLYTTDPVILAGLRYRLELGFSINGSTGTLVLKVNGTELFNLTNQNTRNGVDGFNAILLGNTKSPVIYFDDVLIDTDKTAFRGDFYGELLSPNSDITGYSTPSAGSDRWATIDELPYSATDYTSFPGTGIDQYGLTNLSSSPATIHGVTVSWIAKKNDVGDCSARSLVYSGTGVYTGTSQSINVGAARYREVLQTDPNTGGSWSASSVNNATIGVERTV